MERRGFGFMVRDPELIGFIDGVVLRMQMKAPGVRVSRESVAREILWDFLGHPERERRLFGTRAQGAPIITPRRRGTARIESK